MWSLPRPDVVGVIAAACFLAVPQQQAPAPGIELLVERIEDRYEDTAIRAHFVQRRLTRLGSAAFHVARAAGEFTPPAGIPC